MSRFIEKLSSNNEVVNELLGKLKDNKNFLDYEKLGLALSKDSEYDKAITAYSLGIAINPLRGILYRYRGHRYISVSRFEEGVSDLEMAARLIPDNWDVWYHLGLGYFLLERYDEAKEAYEACYKLNYDDDSKVAITNWLWITLKRLGLNDEANQVLNIIPMEGLNIEDNEGYYELIKLYQNNLDADELFDELKITDDSLKVVTIGFGLSNYYYFNDQAEKRDEVLKFVSEALKDTWKYAFGYLATQVDLNQ